jgi:Helix-turn-helix domain
MLRRILCGCRTDVAFVARVCALPELNVIASLACEVGDDGRTYELGAAMSYAAIAAALALDDDTSVSERLVALSLASYANREQLAWPGDRTAAARAGLSRSSYLKARRELEQRGLVAVGGTGRGGGSSTTLRLLFATTGPWWDGALNVNLLQAILEHGRSRGAARLLLVTMAAAADEQGAVATISRDELCVASGLPRTTFRRARDALQEAGEIVLEDPGGGRGRTARWSVVDPRTSQRDPTPVAGRRPVEMSGARSLTIAQSDARRGEAASGPRNGPRAVPCPRESGPQTGPRTGPESGPQTGPESGPNRPRAGREASNLEVRKPPAPLPGGTPSQSSSSGRSRLPAAVGERA